MLQQVLGRCPICDGELRVTEYTCGHCGVSIGGEFRSCDFCRLPRDASHFIRLFLKCEGNFREIEKELGISYPTVKSRLAKINERLGLGQSSSDEKPQTLELLQQFKNGEVTKDELLKRL